MDYIQNLSQKTAIVTGASSGIGAATTRLLASLGCSVLAVARREERLQSMKNEFPDLITPVVQDVTKDLNTLEAAIQNLKIDILVNNAGGALGREAIQDCPREKWQGMIDMNVKGLIQVTQLVLPKMLEQKSGDIVNLGSIAGQESYGGGSIYCATKFAVKAMTQAWQEDVLGKGIRVMAIHPGLVETEFSLVRFSGDEDQAKQVYQGMTPLYAEDIAQSIVWMLSQPKHVNIPSLTILPTHQASAKAIYRE